MLDLRRHKTHGLTGIDRNSETNAAEVFDRLYPDSSVRRSCCHILADCIEQAHALGDRCWSVTLYRKLVRLNVGQVEMLAFRQDHVLLVVSSRDLGEAQHAKINGWIAKNTYRSLKFSHTALQLPPAMLKDIYPALHQSHHSCLVGASRNGGGTPFAKSFSSGVIWYLRKITGRPIPFPNYIKSEILHYGPQEFAEYAEGTVRERISIRYDRQPALRDECLRHHGTICSICRFDFGQEFGPQGEGLIHVHHLHPLCKVKTEHVVDPKNDLIPVCPNCHAMIHRRNPPYRPDELIAMKQTASSRRQTAKSSPPEPAELPENNPPQ